MKGQDDEKARRGDKNAYTFCSILMAEFESVKHQIENIRTSVKAEIEWQKKRG